MSMVTRKGIYLARPQTSVVEEKNTGTVQFNGVFLCTQILNGAGFEPVQGEERITAFLNIVQKNGQLNEINVRSLKEGLGWDGKSFADLQKDDWGDVECQLVVDFEKDQSGQDQLKVKYLNPKDYQPGGNLEKAEPQKIQSLDAKYGPLLRAMSGAAATKPMSAPLKPPTSVGNSQAIGKDMAWTSFTRMIDDYGQTYPENAYDQQRRVDTFRKVVTKAAAGRDPKTLTAGDWAVVQKQIEKDFSPAAGELLPF